MAENSNIEWTDHTFNPWIGCTKVSPGCANCYAETLDRNRYSKTLDGGTKETPVSHWGPGAPRHRTSAQNWKQPLRWNDEAGAEGWQRPLPVGCRPRVFCASLADWLDIEVPIEWLADLLELIHKTPNLDWLLLTKRPENFTPRLESVFQFLHRSNGNRHIERDNVNRWVMDGVPPANVWIGATVENQDMAEKRIPELLQIPARVRFLSCEPLLGPVDLVAVGDLDGKYQPRIDPGIDWVICGGESGPKARPMHPGWARSLRDQCQASGVPFFFKQWGEYVDGWVDGNYSHHGFSDAVFSTRVGKKAAGRILDGRTWDEFPSTHPQPAAGTQ